MELENTEKMSVKDRLVIFINSRNLSQGRFEKMANLSNGYINNIRNSISDKIFDQRIAPAFPDLNKMWLLHGEGEMDNQSPREKGYTSSKSIKDLPHGDQMEMLLLKIEELETKVQIHQERDRLYLKSIIEHLGINDEKLDEDIEKIEKKSSAN